MMEQRLEARRERYGRAYELVKPFRGRVLLILGCTLLGTGFGVVQPLLYKMAFDGVSGPGATRALLEAVALVFGLGLVRMAVDAVGNVARWNTQVKLQADLQATLVRRLHTLPVSFHQQHAVGGLIQRLDRGVSGVIGAFTSVAFELLPSTVYLVLSIVVMLRLNVQLALLTMIFAPLPALIGVWASREQAAREKTLLERWTKIYARMGEVLGGIVTVRSFAMEEAENRRFLQEV
ncbi:MAG TPA: ABC transporter ATP-binding protein, partial [Longimicrobiales bacterium]